MERNKNMLNEKKKKEIIENHNLLHSEHGLLSRYKVTITLKPVAIEVLCISPIALRAMYSEVGSDKEAREIAIELAKKHATEDLISKLETFHETSEWLQKHIKGLRAVRGDG